MLTYADVCVDTASRALLKTQMDEVEQRRTREAILKAFIHAPPPPTPTTTTTTTTTSRRRTRTRRTSGSGNEECHTSTASCILTTANTVSATDDTANPDAHPHASSSAAAAHLECLRGGYALLPARGALLKRQMDEMQQRSTRAPEMLGQHTSACVGIRQPASAYVGIRQHASAPEHQRRSTRDAIAEITDASMAAGMLTHAEIC
jgi:hypothetical protein